MEPLEEVDLVQEDKDLSLEVEIEEAEAVSEVEEAVVHPEEDQVLVVV